MAAGDHQCSCCSGPVSSVHQTLDEMDFERGLLDFHRSGIFDRISVLNLFYIQLVILINVIGV